MEKNMKEVTFEGLDEAQKKNPKTVDSLVLSYLRHSGLVPAEAKN